MRTNNRRECQPPGVFAGGRRSARARPRRHAALAASGSGGDVGGPFAPGGPSTLSGASLAALSQAFGQQ